MTTLNDAVGISSDRRMPSLRSWSRVSIEATTAWVFFGVYLALEVRRYVKGQATGFDLGIFTQIVRSYSNFSLPYAPLKGPAYDALGDHFHPILAVIAPFYRLFPSSVTLLVFQAALAALPVIPLMGWARESRGSRFAWWIGVSYGASWGIAELVAFDFHEVAFAVPFVALSVCALGRERWAAAAWWAVPLVLVKEDLGLTVAAIGAYIAWRGPRKAGAALLLFGAAASALEILVILPALNPSGHFAYLSQATPHHGLAAELVGMAWPPTKWLTIVLLLAPTGFLAIRSPLLVVALPTVGWRFAASNPAYWGTHYHYSAVLMPVVFAAAIQATQGSRLRPATVRLACGIGTAVTTLAFFAYPLHEVVMPSTWSGGHAGDHRWSAEAMLGAIPSGMTVAASNQLAAQLAARNTVSQVCLFPGSVPATVRPEWIVYDSKDPTQDHCKLSGQIDAFPEPKAAGYRFMDRADGVTLLLRDDLPIEIWTWWRAGNR